MQDYDRFIALSTLPPEAAAAQRRTVFLSAPQFAVVQTEPGQALEASLKQQTYTRYVLSDLAHLPNADYYLFLPGTARLSAAAARRSASIQGAPIYSKGMQVPRPSDRFVPSKMQVPM